MSTKSKRIGVLLTRGQPFHKGHMEIIKKASTENDGVIVIIGSANKFKSERNPLNINQRINLISRLINHLNLNNVHYMTLCDWSSDSDIPYDSENSKNTDYESVSGEWGMYLYYNIVNNIHQKSFTLYYNDDHEVLDCWFPGFIRKRIHVESTPRISEYSSTKVRKACFDNNMTYLKNALPYLTENEINCLREEITL